MARSRTIQYGAINISADPHPAGTYPKIMNYIARTNGPAHGSDRAKLTRARDSGIESVALGRILVWTHIDKDSPWIDLKTEEEVPQADLDEIIPPENYGPNMRVFSFAFHEAKHKLYVETRNEFGQTLGIRTVERLLKSIVARFSGTGDWPEITITTVPHHETIKRILALENLRRLEIDLTVPNPDHDDPATRQRFYEKMRAMKAKKWEQTLVKAAGQDRLEPSDEIRDAAVAAAADGEVRGWGKENGRPVELSTKDTPWIEKAKLDDGENFAQRILAARGFF